MRRHARPLGLAGAGVLVAALAACAGGGAASTAAAAPSGSTGADAGAAAASPATASASSPTTAAPRHAAPRPATRTTRPTTTRSATRPTPTIATVAAGALRGSGTWRRAFAAHAGAIGCTLGLAQLRASDTPRLTFGRTTVFVGFQQYGTNQDPVFVRFDGRTEVYCEHHEHQAPDGRALGLTWDGGPTAYVVYTVAGGGTELEAKARHGWLSGYGDGGASAKVTVVGQVELRYGTVQRASFVVARLVKNGQVKTNSLVPVAAPERLADGRVAVLAGAAFSPLNPDRSPMCAGGSEYPAAGPRAGGASFVGVFAASLSSLTCARTWGCGHVRRPCPNVP